MLPNVRVTVNEEVLLNSDGLNTFLPLLILKTVTGPIGTEVLVKNYKQFISTFGTPDSNTPEAFGVGEYIKNYGSVYVTRVAGSTAAYATGKISVGEVGSAVDLISFTSNYKTSELNGDEIDLVKDSTNNKIYLSYIKGSTSITSIKETFVAGTSTADVLSVALQKLVDSFNAAQNYVTLTNLFVEKTEEDPVPTLAADNKGSITGGSDGNSAVTSADVTAIAERYEESDLGIDALLAPGFEDSTTINKLASIATKSSFIAIASLSGTTTTDIIAKTAGIVENASLALYAGNVKLNADTTISVPASIAVMPAYITKDTSSKWLAPAGVTRGTLPLVNILDPQLGDNDLEVLYSNDIPLNGIRKIAGTGYVVWGQKTSLQDNTEYQDRINVVRLIKYLTREVYKLSYDYLFEPITDYTYKSWTISVEAILKRIQAGNGLSAYKVIMDDTLNTEETKKKNMLIGVVRLKPLEAAEFIDINFVVTDSVEGGNE